MCWISGTKREHFAKIAHKNHLHSVHNEWVFRVNFSPIEFLRLSGLYHSSTKINCNAEIHRNSQFRKEYTMDEIMKAKKIYEFIGLLECSYVPRSHSTASFELLFYHNKLESLTVRPRRDLHRQFSAVNVSSRNIRNCGSKLSRSSVWQLSLDSEHAYTYRQTHVYIYLKWLNVEGMSMGTDVPNTFDEDNMKMIGFDMVERVAKRLYEETGYGPKDVQVLFQYLFQFLKLTVFEGDWTARLLRSEWIDHVRSHRSLSAR